jgi:serine/threonine protein kinase
MNDDYKIMRQIGSGSFASVYEAIHQPTQLIVAIKIVYKTFLNTTKKKNNFLTEFAILKSLNHPLISEFYDFFESDEAYIIVMEYLPNGNLFELIQKNKKIEENDAKR